MKYNSKRGFTLIELLVVIAIIGILSSVVLASLNTARLKARDARRISDIKNLQLALELYADDNDGNYPLALTTLVDPIEYIRSIPVDPSTGNSYRYASGEATVVGTEYHLGADLEGANMPDNDANCSSVATLACYDDVLDGGFDGTAAGIYDQRQ